MLITHDAEQAERCLRGIETLNELVVECETVILLNASSDAVHSLIDQRTSGARVIESPVNTGTAAGWQLAFTAARGERVLLMHEDSVVAPEMTRRLMQTLDERPDAGVVGPWIIERDEDTPTNAGWFFWRELRHSCIHPDNVPPEQRDAPYPVDVISGAVSLWDKAAWLEAGGFDERRFPAVGVDVDACVAMWARGRTVLVEPRAVGIHRTGAMDSAERTLSGPQMRFYLYDRFLEFWHEKFAGLENELVSMEENDWTFPIPQEAVDAVMANALERYERGFKMVSPPLAVQNLTNPGRVEPAPIAVDDAIAERLRDAEREQVELYCAWLIERDKKLTQDIENLWDGIHGLEVNNAALAVRSEMLEGILDGGWWKLRGRLRKLLGRPA